jgi:phosphinothricin acetyltransferase
MTIIRDATEADLPSILAITNHAILNTTAIWSVTPLTLDARRSWFRERRSRALPILVATVEAGTVLGFASFGDFRPWDAYLHTVEHSLYVDPAAQGNGVGTALLAALIERAAALGKHRMIAGIEAGNLASIRLHQKAGFEEAGRLSEVGRKFDRWMDLVFMQRAL